MIQALIAGGFLGIAIAFILEQLDQTVKQVDEVKQITQLPLLGVIPRVAQPSIVANIHTTKQAYSYYSSYTEGLRSLAMNLRYLKADERPIRTLAVTSSTSAEGKSTISHNLGIVLAELNLRILVVDGDLRKPKLHKLAEVGNKIGLQEIITQELSWANNLQSSSVENLDLITAGATSPNPIALLNSSRMKQLVREWSAAYDYVIIDTPPIGVIGRCQDSGKRSRFNLVCFRDRTRQSSSDFANSIETMRSSQSQVAGVVVNMVDPELDYYAYSYYDSYYNQPQNSDRSKDINRTEDKKKKGLLEQFRRR